MLSADSARWLADAVLLLHFAIVLFVVLGLPAIVIGNRAGWTWVNRLGFRLTHLAAIAIVALQAWFGRLCPLTVWEATLRRRAGQATYERSFMEAWLQRLLYYEAPWWVFIALYTGFALLVVWAWWRFPPRPRLRHPGGH